MCVWIPSTYEILGGKIGRMKYMCHSELKTKGAGVWNFKERKGERFSGRFERGNVW